MAAMKRKGGADAGAGLAKRSKQPKLLAGQVVDLTRDHGLLVGGSGDAGAPVAPIFMHHGTGSGAGAGAGTLTRVKQGLSSGGEAARDDKGASLGASGGGGGGGGGAVEDNEEHDGDEEEEDALVPLPRAVGETALTPAGGLPQLRQMVGRRLIALGVQAPRVQRILQQLGTRRKGSIMTLASLRGRMRAARGCAGGVQRGHWGRGRSVEGRARGASSEPLGAFSCASWPRLVHTLPQARRGGPVES